MLRLLMFPKVGWWVLHALAISLMFLLGYSVRFKF
jgi:hypothetical protein